MDVYKQEPLSSDSELWKLPNVLMTPHCADITDDFCDLSMNVFLELLSDYAKDQPFKSNIVNKALGY